MDENKHIHDEKGCCGEHEHEHEHAHCCEHEHGHEHCHECGCGHCHNDEEEPHVKLYIISAVIFALSFFARNITVGALNIQFIIIAAATLLCGFDIFKNGLKSIAKFRFDESTLILVAVVSAALMREFNEMYMITLLFAIGEAVEDYAVDKSRERIEGYIDLTDDTAYNELGEKIDASKIKIGDRILIKPGDKVCVDAKIIRGNTSFDTSNLTGESLPCDMSEGDTVISGSINLTSSVVCEAMSDFSNSTAAKIKDYVQGASKQKAETEKFITHFARVYTPAVIGFSGLLALVLIVFRITTVPDAINRALTIMIASCPCALVIGVPLTYFGAIGSISKSGILVKGSKFINSLAKSNAIAFDKTGTLTTGKLSVKNTVTLDGYDSNEVLGYAAALENNSSHPVARAICEYFKGNVLPAEDVNELFGKGMTGTVNGKKIAVGNRKIIANDTSVTPDMQDASVFVCVDGKLAGAITLSDTIKENAPKAIDRLHEMGISKMYVLSGDNTAAVERTCAAFGGKIKGFGALMPTEKTDKINEIKSNSSGLIYVGDGVNDAPSLCAADVGIAVGSANSLALEAGDATLVSGNLESIASAVGIARYAMRILYSNIAFALIVKFAVLVVAMFGKAPLWLALLADVGVLIISVLRAVSVLGKK